MAQSRTHHHCTPAFLSAIGGPSRTPDVACSCVCVYTIHTWSVAVKIRPPCPWVACGPYAPRRPKRRLLGLRCCFCGRAAGGKNLACHPERVIDLFLLAFNVACVLRQLDDAELPLLRAALCLADCDQLLQTLAVSRRSRSRGRLEASILVLQADQRLLLRLQYLHGPQQRRRAVGGRGRRWRRSCGVPCNWAETGIRTGTSFAMLFLVFASCSLHLRLLNSATLFTPLLFFSAALF